MTTPFSKLRDTAMTDPAQPDEYAKLKAQKEAILLRQSPNKKLLSRLVELKELVENYHGVFPNRAVIEEALRDAAAALVSPPVQPVEATPETDAMQNDMAENCRADGLSDFPAYAHGLLKHARSLERRLQLSQTENAGHIRIEDELKAELRLAASALTAFNRKLTESQARCAELEKDAARWRFYEAAMKPGSGYQFGYGMPWLDSLKNEVQIEKGGEVIAKGRTLGAAIDAAISAGKT